MAAIEAWLSVRGSLPVNVKLVIEGEEEIGSPNLARYMDEYPDAFFADLMVLTDGENPSDEIPGLTVSLRGVFKVELSCESLEADAHSGLWGNMAPDPGNALVSLLSRLLDQHGRMRLGRMVLPEPVQQSLAQVPLSCRVIREAIRAVEGVEPLPLDGRSAAEWLWRQPAVTILSTTLPRPSHHKNAVRARAAATLSIRLAPGQGASQMMNLLQAELLRDPPGGVKVSLRELPNGGESWLCEPQGDAYEAASRAYQKSWGRPLYPIGLGGTIPLVSIFSGRYPGVPLILNGVLDPKSGAHGPDESLHLGVFAKTIAATVQLFNELATGTSAVRARRSIPRDPRRLAEGRERGRAPSR
jgi:acetylornithine deacetylase/succinyl-diaminopimelate desuccinylase-like protein